MPRSNPDTLPTSTDPTGPCPYCGRVSNFRDENNMPLRIDPERKGVDAFDAVAHLMRCMACNQGVMVVEDRDGHGMHSYPTAGTSNLDSSVDAKVASCYAEGMQCLSVGANRSAAVMFRSALHCFIKDKGDQAAKDERHLKNALKHMKTANSLHPALWEWASELNQLGNEGAHPEDYDEVSAAEATALGDFVRQLIKLEYEMVAQLGRLRAKDSAAIAAEDGAPEAPPN